MKPCITKHGKKFCSPQKGRGSFTPILKCLIILIILIRTEHPILLKTSARKKARTWNYLSYLQYCNTKLIQLVDHILSNTSRPPVILLMSDHGFREFAHDSVNHKYHFMNLNAMYLPQKQYRNFYKGVSTVNLFRILLNAQFGQNLPLLKDSSSFLMEK